jgi:hypothetical protein
MSTESEVRAYGKLRDIIERCGGSMTYRRQGYRYGAWKISLDGKTKIFESTGNRRLPALDRLYVPNVRNPKTWDDYSDELVPDAERQLLGLALARSEMTKQRWKNLLGRWFRPRPIADPEVFEGVKTETVVYSRGRSRALRDRALELAKNICEACQVDFGKLLGGKGVRVLQVHHRKQLGSTDHPRLTRVKDLAVLCANCHALVHTDPKRALAVSVLRRMLSDSSGDLKR